MEENYKISVDERTNFIGKVLEVVEDFLEEKGIDIPNPEKENDPYAAILYGTDYGILQSGIEDVLEEYKEVK